MSPDCRWNLTRNRNWSWSWMLSCSCHWQHQHRLQKEQLSGQIYQQYVLEEPVQFRFGFLLLVAPFPAFLPSTPLQLWWLRQTKLPTLQRLQQFLKPTAMHYGIDSCAAIFFIQPHLLSPFPPSAKWKNNFPFGLSIVSILSASFFN